MEIIEEVNAAKDSISRQEVLNLFRDAERIVVASGKKILEFEASAVNQEIIDKVCGRSGKLRAPTLRIGKTFYVGFNEEMYGQRIK